MARKRQKWSHNCQYPSMWDNKRLFASSKLFHFPETNSIEDFWGLKIGIWVAKGLTGQKVSQNWSKASKMAENSCHSYVHILYEDPQLVYGPSTTLFSLNDLNWDWQVWTLSTWVYILIFYTKIVPCIHTYAQYVLCSLSRLNYILNKYLPAVIMFNPASIMYVLLSVINCLIDIHETHEGNVNWSGHTFRRNIKK